MRKIIFIIFLLFFSSNGNCSIDFNGSNDFVNLQSNASLDNLQSQGGGGLTIAAWIYPRTFGDLSRGAIFSKATIFSNPGFLSFRVWNVSGESSLNFLKDAATDIGLTASNNCITLNTWQHVAVTWDGGFGATAVNIYVNGVNVGSGNGSGVSPAVSDASENAYLGNDGSGVWSFIGLESDIGVWNKVLNQSEIKILSSSRIKGIPLQISPNNLKAYISGDDFDDNSLASKATGAVKDRSRFTNNGTCSGTVRGKAEQILSYP